MPSQGEQGHISIFYLLPISANKKLVFRDVPTLLRIATNTYVDRMVERLEKNMHKQLEGVVQRIVHVTLYSTSVECCNTGACQPCSDRPARSDSCFDAHTFSSNSVCVLKHVCFTDTGNSVKQPRSLIENSRSFTQIPRHV